MMQVEISVESDTTSTSCPGINQFQAWAEAALHGREGNFNLAIRIVDEAEMQQFNSRYRQKDYATNVLSFAADLPDALPENLRRSQLGDLLICAPVVACEALEQKREEADHWAHLTIHGVLHLLGYDHELADEASIMETLETNILAKLGISDPYLDLS